MEGEEEMKKLSRAKLLFAGAVLVVLGLRATPAEAWCRVVPFIAWSEEECAYTCWEGGCYGYSYDEGGGCFCS